MGRQQVVVADTHALFWWVTGSARLSVDGREALDAADIVGFSAMTVFELATLARRERIAVDRPLHEWIDIVLGTPSVKMFPITIEIATSAASLSMHGDPADRLIVATALGHNAPLVTKDDRIRAAGVVETIW